jgi:hypothetical protein
MINTQMRSYKYTKLDGVDDYGQPATIEAEDKIKMSINFANEAIQENALYSGATYVGLTFNKNIDASYIIHYSDTEKLKVTYVNKFGKYSQVFLARV